MTIAAIVGAQVAAMSALTSHRERVRAIKWIGLDVDGVLTDAGVYIGADGVEFKRFDIQDGYGIKLAQRAGLEFAFVSARPSVSTTARAKELGVTVVQTGTRPKHLVVEELLSARGLTWREAAFVGDDLIDIPVLSRVGLAVAPANAVAEVRDIAAHVLDARGGHGAVREFITWLFTQRGEWEALVEDAVRRLEEGT